MDLYPVDWHAGDEDDQYIITVFGKSDHGELVAARIAFYPYFYVKIPLAYTSSQVKSFIYEACKKHHAIEKYCRDVRRVSLWGFTNNTPVRLVQVAFSTMQQMKWAARKYRSMNMLTFESSVDPLLRFFHIRDIAPAQWILIKGFAEVGEDGARTRAALEISTEFDKVFPSTCTKRPPLVLASWDIEAYSKDRKFPQASKQDDHIIQIATTFQRYGEPDPYRTLVVAYKETDPVPGVDLQWYDSEAEMITAWCNELARESVDVLISYNGDQVGVGSLKKHTQQLPDPLV